MNKSKTFIRKTRRKKRHLNQNDIVVNIQMHRVIEYPETEGTHKDHKDHEVQLQIQEECNVG